jgi:hypothetical protein
MKSTRRSLARNSALLVVAVGLLASCRSVPWEGFLPRDVFPAYAVARLKGALLMGDYGDSYESLTKKTREEISYITWRVAIEFKKIGEYKLYDILVNCKVVGEIRDERNPNTVHIVCEYENWGGSIPVKREDGNWKVGFYEFVVAEGEELEQ